MNLTITEVPTLRGVHAQAVGRGISWALFASAEEPRTPEEWVHLCCTAADEAEAAAAEHPEETAGEGHRMLIGFLNEMRQPGEDEYVPDVGNRRTEAIIAAGAAAFMACMPKLTGRRTAQAYIACVAVALQRGYVTGGNAKAMLYTVQLALSAHPKRAARPRHN